MGLGLIVAILIIALVLSGMIYWKIKSDKGELVFSERDWHFRLIHWMWDAETGFVKNVCPYYWSIVFSIVILPLYLVVRGLWVLFKFLKRILPAMPRLKNSKVVQSIREKLPSVPESRKEAFKNVYSQGKDYTGIVLKVALVLFVIAAAFVGVWKTIAFSFTLFLGILGVLLFLVGTVILHVSYPNLDEYHIDHYTSMWQGVSKFFSGVWGIISIPYHLLAGLLSRIGGKISKTYNDNCPMAVWE